MRIIELHEVRWICGFEDGQYSQDELIDECIKHFYYEELGWCGCGRPDMAKRVIRDYLRIIHSFYRSNDNFEACYQKQQEDLQSRFGTRYICDNELLLCLAYALDAAEFTEHGGSISGAWLTKKGEAFLTVLNLDKELVDR